MAKPTNAEIEAKRAVIAEAREQALQAKAETIRVKAHNKAENIRRKADAKAKRAIAKGEAHAAKIEGIVPAEIERKIRLDVHGRPKPLLRGWIHAIATPLALGRGHRADLPRSWHRAQVGVRRVHDLLAGTVRQFRLLSSGRLVTTGYRCAAAHRPYEHLFADRRHLYARFLRAHAVLA